VAIFERPTPFFGTLHGVVTLTHLALASHLKQLHVADIKCYEDRTSVQEAACGLPAFAPVEPSIIRCICDPDIYVHKEYMLKHITEGVG